MEPEVEIFPKPAAMEPVVRAPTVVMLVEPVQVERAVFSTLFKASMVLTWAVLRARGVAALPVLLPMRELAERLDILAKVTAELLIVKLLPDWVRSPPTVISSTAPAPAVALPRILLVAETFCILP